MIIIMTGKIGSGKTTMLEKWVEKKKDISGILMPVLDGARYLYSISSGELVPIEVRDEVSSDEIVRIGKYRFSRKVFTWGNNEILRGFKESNTIIIDEIGPLELRGEGFSPAVEQILEDKIKLSKKTIIPVVREELVRQVLDHYNIYEHVIIRSLKELKNEMF